MRLLPAQDADRSPLQRDLRTVTLAWAFGSAWLWIISGAVMTRFVTAAGLPDWGFGFLAAIPFLGALSQLPASWWINARGGRRTLFLVLGTVGRLGFTAAAVLPWLMPASLPAWPGVVAVLLLAWSCMQATGPAWMNWMSDLIPRRIRGRYFARRASLVTPVAIAASIGSALLLDAFGGGGEPGPGADLGLTSAMVAAAGALGAIDILLFLRIADPHAGPRKQRHDRPPFRVVDLLNPLRDAHFRHFLGLNFGFTLATAFIGQYLWLYVLDAEQGLGWSNLKANLLIISVPMVTALFTRPFWGRMCDRRGKKPVVLISGGVVCFGAVGWGIMTPELFWPGYLIVILTTAAWPGMELANFNFLLEFSKDADRSRRDERGAGAQSAALLSVATAVAGGLSGLVGGVVAHHLRGWSDVRVLPAGLPLGLGGVVFTFTFFHVLFALSTLLRFGALAFALGLREPAAAGTRDVVRFMAAGLYNNVRVAATTPVRLPGLARKWAYRLPRPRVR
ncbi:MFS transporter [Phycisphaera mikurensis]|uniref:Major facilitator superfamily protein n=1 Tax=Phycisphaera mikurensis (strain NBRC 102666 / KCTC 22515 / FYK2301M01) TaxID=1142394 RepID=I0ID30_PHYMF|nr:MFS transporter [Phycisphaera mikurensis]MBB6442293.1 MFS family permease [Phycisphaera mikurensis]BAM03168.1 major facilitator superfamily protein [Phycisphaera mikurensis NBRC 102666]